METLKGYLVNIDTKNIEEKKILIEFYNSSNPFLIDNTDNAIKTFFDTCCLNCEDYLVESVGRGKLKGKNVLILHCIRTFIIKSDLETINQALAYKNHYRSFRSVNETIPQLIESLEEIEEALEKTEIVDTGTYFDIRTIINLLEMLEFRMG